MFIETPGKVKIIQKDQRLDISNISLTLGNFFHMKQNVQQAISQWSP